jgi:predicted Zn-dependent protease
MADDRFDEFEMGLEEILGLSEEGSHQAALERLDALEADFATGDDAAWARRSLLAVRGQLLLEVGHLDEALGKLREAQALEPEPLEFVSNQEVIANVLHGKGDGRAAIQELQRGLERAKGDAEGLALRLLMRYAEIARSLGEDVPLTYARQLAESAGAWGYTIPQAALRDENVQTEVLLGMRRRMEEED